MAGIWTALLSVIKNILLKMVSEKFLQWGLFFFGRMIVESTKTKKDDEFLTKLEEIVKD